MAFDSVTGYRDAARAVVAYPPAGSVLAAWQSGAFGYFANDRIEVVNVDGVVNPDAARAYHDDTTVAYMRDRGVNWLADFTLHLVWFGVKSKQQLREPPSVDVVRTLPQFPPFPEYGLAEIHWPPRPRGVPADD